MIHPGDETQLQLLQSCVHSGVSTSSLLHTAAAAAGVSQLRLHCALTHLDTHNMILLLLLTSLLVTSQARRVSMDQMKSCYYQPHNRELVCQCQYGEDNSFLHLRLTEFMDRARQEVSKYINILRSFNTLVQF